MAETAQEKSRGLKFAGQQLLRHGWEQGKGLGRQENGICEAIIECGKGGMGQWDHVFNKASSSLEVESGENGVQVKKLVEEEGMISNKQPTKAEEKLYGCFVKSATLLAGLAQPEKSSSTDDSSSSDDEDQRLELSSTTNPFDADLVKACGGRTAHKGARHGLTMSAKLARLEQQEQEFMAKYGKKNHQKPTAATPDSVTTITRPAAQIPEGELTDETQGGKKRKNHEDTLENVAEENADSAVVSKSTNMEIKVKKKDSSNSGEVAVVPVEEELTSVEDNTADNAQPTQRKVLEEGESCHLNGVCETAVISIESEAGGGGEEASEGEGATQQQTDSTITKKKSSKKEVALVAEEMKHDRETNQSETVADSPPKEKKKRDGAIEEVRTVEEEPKIKGKKKKCKEDKQTVEYRLHDVSASIPLKMKTAKQQEPD
ncbi:LOW QUALITY PROTEIN: G patch domain-containing protein 4 [Salvelinus alpinus]